MNRRVAVVGLEVGLIGSAALLAASAMRSCQRIETVAPPPLVIASPPRPEPPPPPIVWRHAGPCRELHDFKFAAGHVGADGIADEVITWTYDGRGRAVREDSHRDDAPDRSYWFEYDPHDQVKREVFGLSDGSHTSSIKTYVYDDHGREVANELEEFPGHGRWMTTRSYNAAGELAVMQENIAAGRRRGIGHWYTYEDGRLVVEKVDNDGDGEPNLAIRYRYDAGGNLATKHSHWYGEDCWNTPTDEVFTYTHDDHDRVTGETDLHGFTWVTRYDAAGNILEKVQQVPKQLADQTPMIRITYTYDCW